MQNSPLSPPSSQSLSIPTPPQRLLWITDPWSTLDREKDTTLRLAHEAEILGIESWWSSSELVLAAKKKFLRVIPLKHAPDHDYVEDLSPSKFAQIHFRVDPPVNDSYRKLILDIESRIEGAASILNPPGLVIGQSEKLPPEDLRDLAPDHQVLSSANDIAPAFARVRGWDRWVSKPMHLAQSQGVRSWPRPESVRDFERIIKSEAHEHGYPLLAQEYLSGITRGEVRLWFVMGRFLGALRKYPLTGDFRVLIDSGSRIEPHELTPGETRIADRISSSLRRQKIALAAIDLIDSRISDYNITSPGLLVQLEKAHGKNFARTAIQVLLQGF